MKTGIPLPVTVGALVKRINRKLAPDCRQLKKTREGSRCYHDLGDFHIVDHGTNSLVDTNVDVEHLARELGVMYPREKLQD